LLEAEGLVVAIGQQARSAAIQVSIDGDGLGRYPRDIEAAVYFSVLEALQNVGKYAEASTVTVTLSGNEEILTFQVADDGRGFDPASIAPGAGLNGIADRLDTIGGTVHVDSSPGTGTIITGTIPTRAPIQAGG
jgi:signal transduction histidine kinase